MLAARGRVARLSSVHQTNGAFPALAHASAAGPLLPCSALEWIGTRQVEVLLAIFLDQDQRPFRVDLIGECRRDRVQLPARALFERCFALGASGLLLAHNHPSGDPRPSGTDLAATRRFARLARDLDIRLHDHLIVAGQKCISMRAAGLL